VRPLPQAGTPPVIGPPGLPVAWFAAAVYWFAAAAAALLLAADDLSRGLAVAPRVFTAVHALTLGVLSSAVFGALHQFVPAVMGVGSRNDRLAVLGFVAFQAGIVALLVGFWRWAPGTQAIAWGLLMVGVFGASWNTVYARRRAVRNRVVGLCISLAHSALGVAMLIAFVRIGDGLGWWHTSRDGLVLSHYLLGVAGFGSLTVLGVGSRMLPAFLGAAPPSDGTVRTVAWTIFTGLVLVSVGAVWRLDGIRTIGAAVTIVGAVAHATLLGQLLVRRSRPMDPALALIGLAMVGYGLAIALGIALAFGPTASGSRWVTFVVAGLLGWLVPMILGVMHRVVPRILTLHAAHRVRPSPAGQREQLVHGGLGWTLVGLLAGSLVVLLAGITTGHQAVTRAGASLLTLAAIVLGWQAGLVVTRVWSRP